MIDPVGKLITDLRADTGLAAEVGNKVWGGELPERFEGEALPPDPRPFVLLSRLGVGRIRAPQQRVRIAVRCVHKTERDAARLYGLVSDVLHNHGPRKSTAGVAIYRSNEEVGGQPDLDPITNWPSETAIYEVFAASLALT